MSQLYLCNSAKRFMTYSTLYAAVGALQHGFKARPKIERRLTRVRACSLPVLFALHHVAALDLRTRHRAARIRVVCTTHTACAIRAPAPRAARRAPPAPRAPPALRTSPTRPDPHLAPPTLRSPCVPLAARVRPCAVHAPRALRVARPRAPPALRTSPIRCAPRARPAHAPCPTHTPLPMRVVRSRVTRQPPSCTT
jgi:hypothetical protein